jgi:hypothetical protein
MRPTKPRFCTRLTALLVGLGLLALNGCGSGKGSVSGKVTYQGRPIVIGSVVMTAKVGPPVVGALDAEGHYALKGVPAGPVNVAVVTTLPVYMKGPTAFHGKRGLGADNKEPESKNSVAPLPEPPKIDLEKWIQLPKEYERADTSGISTTVKPGNNLFNIELP